MLVTRSTPVLASEPLNARVSPGWECEGSSSTEALLRLLSSGSVMVASLRVTWTAPAVNVVPLVPGPTSIRTSLKSLSPPPPSSLSSKPIVSPVWSGWRPETTWPSPSGFSGLAFGEVLRRIGSKEDVAGDLLAIRGHQFGRRIEDRRGLAVALEHKVDATQIAVEGVALGDHEQTEFLPRVQLARIVQLAEQHLIAFGERAAARMNERKARIELGLLDLGKHDLGIDDLAARVDQEDAERVHERSELAVEYDRRIAALAEGEVVLIDAVDLGVRQPDGLAEVRKRSRRLELRRGRDLARTRARRGRSS